MQLSDMVKQPGHYFGKLGFETIDEGSYGSESWVWYRKLLFTVGMMNVIVEVRFSLVIEDDPFVRYDDNLYYCFSTCKLISTERDLSYVGHLDGNDYFRTEEETLRIQTTAELKSFLLSASKVQSFM